MLNRPLLGANFDFWLDNAVPFGLVFLDFLQAGLGAPLPTPLFAGACTYYLGPNPPLSFAVANGTVASSFTPNNTVFLGVPFALQGGGILPNGQLAASNAINGTVGNW